MNWKFPFYIFLLLAALGLTAVYAVTVKADDLQAYRIQYLERWIKGEALLLTQPDYKPSSRQTRRKLLKILKGSWRGYSC